MKVVVVGAGYAGTIAANRLIKQVPDAQVTVVNPRPEFVERVRLHQQISGTGEAGTPLSKMLKRGIEMRLGSADRIADGVVLLADGGELEFDHVLVAVGSGAEPIAGTIPVASWEGSARASAALSAVSSGATITVIGAGLTGIEVAAELAETHPDLTVKLIGSQLAPSFSEGGRRYVRASLERLGVQLHEGTVSAVNGMVTLETGEEFASDVNLWAIVSGVPELIAKSGLKTNADGRAVVDEFLRSVDDPRVFVIGDCAAVPGQRMACATAAPQGAHAADTLARTLTGREPKPYSMGYVGQALSLGRHDGVIQMVRRDDTARKLYISGRLAAQGKERICRYAKRATRTAFYFWAK